MSTDARAELSSAITRILAGSRGMPTEHILVRLAQRGIVVDLGALTRALRGEPARFIPDGPRGDRWTLRPSPSPEAAAPRTMVDRLPGLHPWQQEALSAWTEAGHRGIVQAVTGAGKSLVGVAAVRDALQAGLRAVVLVPTTALLDQWGQVLLSSLPGIRVGIVGGGRRDPGDPDVSVATVQSARSAPPFPDASDRVLLIADEAHHYAARTFRPVIRRGHGRALGLTATLARPDGADGRFLIPEIGPIVFELGYERALREGVIAPFDVHLVGISLGAGRIEGHSALEARLSGLRTQLRRHLDPEGRLEDRALHGRIVAMSAGSDAVAALAKEYRSVLAHTMSLLDEAPERLGALDRLLPLIRASHGTIVFTETVRLAQSAARHLRAHGLSVAVITAERGRRARSIDLHRFGARVTEVLIAPRLLDEGVDVPDADLAIVLSASRTRRQMVQRMGRIIRSKPSRENADFVIVYAVDTLEDPDEGAHGAFLEEVLPLAINVRREVVS